MIGSRSVHLRLLHLQCNPGDSEFYLRDFEQPEFNNVLKEASTEDVGVERKGTNMGDTVLLATIYFPLITVGMVWVIIWALSAEGPHPKR
jgi:hypothetical protein